MNNFYVDSSVEKTYQQNKNENNTFNNNKIITGIILVLITLLTVSIIIASGLFLKNNALTERLSQQTENYMKAVDYYKNLNKNTADTAINDFIEELTGNVLSVNPNSLTKSNLKLFIVEIEDYIKNFDSIGLSSTHPEIFDNLILKLDSAVTALENGTYQYPYSDKDYILMCNLVQREQGTNSSDDEAQCLVAVVALNRKKHGVLYAKDAKDPENPTLLEVITQKGQYGPNYSYNMTLDGVTEKVKENVRKVFEHEYECEDNVLFQTTVYYSDKVMYKSFYNPTRNNYTYFYYGRVN